MVNDHYWLSDHANVNSEPDEAIVIVDCEIFPIHVIVAYTFLEDW